jgi:hypothetical protein
VDYLHRGLDDPGRIAWLAVLHQNGNNLDAVSEKIFGSDEAFAWAKRMSKS